MPPQEFTRRLPYIPMPVTGIKDSRGRVAVLGTLVSKDEENYTFAIDDGEAQVVVILNDMKNFGELEKGKLIRVLGRVIGSGEEAEILADMTQDFSNVDRELYAKHMH